MGSYEALRVYRRVGLTLATVVLGASVQGCWDRAEPDIRVRLEGGEVMQPSVEVDSDDEATVRFVYASVLSPERSTLTYAHLGRYLSSHLGRPVEIVRRRTYAELNALLRSGQADAGLVCSGAFAIGEKEFGLEAVLIPVIAGKRTYRSYVVARVASEIATFDDLQGRSFAFTDPLSNTGYRYVAARLHDRGLAPGSFFSQILFTYSHDNSVEAVRDGIVDAGAIDSLVWDELLRRDPSLSRDLVIIDRSEEFPINPIAVSPHIDPSLRAELVRVLTQMDADPTGREVLEELGTDRWEEPTSKESEGYARIARSWSELGPAPEPTGAGAR
jgi:phosphate/phosphite/phosphonate ABC transporter binding protein